jgi:hypothetical protein
MIPKFFIGHFPIPVRSSRSGVRGTAELAIRCLITNYYTRERCKGGQADFSKNLRACLFNDDIWNKPNFGRIHLAGQYLLMILIW